MTSLERKENALRTRLKKLGSAVVAFSGGVDSSVLLAATTKVLPRDRLLAVTAQSPTYPESELALARRIARKLGVRHEVIRTAEFSNPSFVANPPNRCYYCKSELFSELRRIAERENLAEVLDGTNYDDRQDFRPGRRAAQECGVRSPLLEARLTKLDLRVLAKRYGLPNWGKPAAACLASRVPYGTALSQSRLPLIEQAERLLAREGFSQIRVRDHDPIARIEISPREFARMVRPEVARRVSRGLKRLGFRYVALDLSGYRTGSLNLSANAEARSANVRTSDFGLRTSVERGR